MPTPEEQLRPRRVREPVFKVIETQWRIWAPSRRVLECGLYRIDGGLQVRTGFGGDLLKSQAVISVAKGREVAAEWRKAMVATGGFVELPTQAT
jgi:hypothetical protein